MHTTSRSCPFAEQSMQANKGRCFILPFQIEGKYRMKTCVSRNKCYIYLFTHKTRKNSTRKKSRRNKTKPRRTLMRRRPTKVGLAFFTHYLVLPLTQTRFDHIFFHALVLVFVLICFNTFSKNILSERNGAQRF